MADGTVDTSIYPRANQNSLLDMMGQVQNLQNAQAQNKLLQTSNQRQQVGLSQDQVDYVHKQYDGLMGLLVPLSKDPRISTAQGPGLVRQAANTAVRLGYITPDVAQTATSNMPSDPTKLQQWLQTGALQAIEGGREQFTTIHGSPTVLSDGTTNIPAMMGPFGVEQIGAPFLQTLTPEQRAAQVPGTNANGQPTVTPVATVLKNQGYNSLTALPETAPTGSVNRMQPYGPGNPAPVAAGSSDGSFVTGPPAGQVEAQKKAADISAEKYSADAAEQTNYQQNILPIQQAYEHIKALGPTGVGPGTEEINQFKSFVQSMGLGTLAGIDPQKINDFDQGNKYASAAMRANGFTGSDAQLEAARKASVTMNTSQGAALAVLQKMAAMTRMKNAQVQAFQESGRGPQDYSKWAASWNAKQNGAAYAFDMMEPDQRQKYVKSLSAADQDKFFDSLQTAMQLGLVTPPNGN